MADVRGVSRILSKLEKSISEGKYYEAHQMYRTLHFRYLAQAKYDELISLLFSGSSLLLSHSQQTSGLDLAMLMLEVLQKSGATCNMDHVAKIIKLFQLLESTERHQFLVAAIKWSSSDTDKLGNPFLHQKLALILWKEKQYSSARYHFLRSEDAKNCAALLIELQMLSGYKSEVDLFVTQAVLQYLCLKKRVTALEVFKIYTCQHPSILKTTVGPPYLLPLLNFLWFLLIAVERGRVKEFQTLCQEYKPNLDRDPLYSDYLKTIGHIFFELPLPNQNQNNIFGNLLQGILGDMEEGESSLQSEEVD